MPGYPEGRTVWYVRKTEEKCAWCGRPIERELRVTDPSTFQQFWSVAEVVREEKAGRYGLCWKCYLEYLRR
jgi:hypothetical protein